MKGRSPAIQTEGAAVRMLRISFSAKTPPSQWSAISESSRKKLENHVVPAIFTGHGTADKQTVPMVAAQPIAWRPWRDESFFDGGPSLRVSTNRCGIRRSRDAPFPGNFRPAVIGQGKRTRKSIHFPCSTGPCHVLRTGEQPLHELSPRTSRACCPPFFLRSYVLARTLRGESATGGSHESVSLTLGHYYVWHLFPW